MADWLTWPKVKMTKTRGSLSKPLSILMPQVTPRHHAMQYRCIRQRSSTSRLIAGRLRHYCLSKLLDSPFSMHELHELISLGFNYWQEFKEGQCHGRPSGSQHVGVTQQIYQCLMVRDKRNRQFGVRCEGRVTLPSMELHGNSRLT